MNELAGSLWTHWHAHPDVLIGLALPPGSYPFGVGPLREKYNRAALLHARTGRLVPSAPPRIGATLLVLLALPASAMHGAARGVTALYCGFVLEVAAVWWFVRNRRPLARQGH